MSKTDRPTDGTDFEASHPDEAAVAAPRATVEPEATAAHVAPEATAAHVAPEATAAHVAPATEPWFQAETHRLRWWASLTFGVLLPLAAVGFESSFHLLEQLVASPIPTHWHTVLLVLIVAGNAAVLVAGPRLAATRTLGWLNGVTIGVSGVYALMFLPLTPIAVVGTMFYGIGLLGFAPAGTLWVAIRGRQRLTRLLVASHIAREHTTQVSVYRGDLTTEGIAIGTGVRGTGAGIVLGIVTLILLEVPGILERHAIAQAASGDGAAVASGVTSLRTWDARDAIVDGCQGQPRAARGVAGLLFENDTPSPQQMRDVFYRVYGQTCPTDRRPQRGIGRISGGLDDWEIFDEDLGSDAVGAERKRLILAASQIDGSIDGDAALGYVEWTLLFRNDNPRRDEEARALLQLPPGGVISRATLWIGDEPREAAFGSRGQTREAYEAVVSRRRDPLLVTTAGPDLALVQCFPVVRKGGEMKIRVGITFPLSPLDERRSAVVIPRLASRNFRVPAATRHSVWLESKQPLFEAGGEVARGPDGAFQLRTEIEEAMLERSPGLLRLASERPRGNAVVEAKDELGVDHGRVEQRISPTTETFPARVVVVLDTSASMAPHLGAMRRALLTIPDGTEVALLVPNDGEEPAFSKELEPMTDEVRTAWEALDLSAAGGRDNVPALVHAWDLTSRPGRGEAIVVWVHGPQRELLSPIEPLLQRFDRAPVEAQLVHLQPSRGEDKIVAALHGRRQLAAIPRLSDATADLQRQLLLWRGELPSFRRELRRSGSARSQPQPNPQPHEAQPNPQPRTAQPNPPAARHGSGHLARLWALSHVSTLRHGNAQDMSQATALATRYQLVTPVSGAVVLETTEQYEAAGLEPVDSDSVPTVPEPEVWALMIMAAGALVWMSRRQRSARGFA